MKIGYYFFGEWGHLNKMLITTGLISLVISAIFFFIGGWEILTRPYAVGNPTYSIWCVFFLLLGIVLFLVDFCIHKICRDIATLLKEIEDNKAK